jgi:hypothetical protein
MLLSATEAIYSGNLPVKKLFTNNKLAYKPKEFPFATLTNSVLSLYVSGAGQTVFNGSWLKQSGVYTKTISLSVIQITNNAVTSSWNFSRVLPSPYTTYYTISGLNPIPAAPPLTGWKSTNSAYDPPPTLIYNYPTSSAHTAVTGAYIFTPGISIEDYYINKTSLVGFASSNFFTSLSSITQIPIPTEFYSAFDTDFFPNLQIYNYYLSANTGNLILNNSKIKTLTVSKQPKLLNLYNNSNLENLTFANDIIFTDDNIINNPSLTSLTVNTNTNLKTLDITKFPKLKTLIINAANLSSLQILQNYPNLNYLSLNCNLTGYQIPDTFLNILSGKLSPQYIINNNSFFGRSSASNEAFLSVYKQGIASLQTYAGDIEIDPSLPIISISPATTYSPSTLGNEIIISCPVSSNNVNFVQHKTLSGIYYKLDNVVYNNRDVFRNINDFYILYDDPNTRWTVVGPTSTSNFIWLSAYEVLNNIGDIPSIGWNGPAYHSGYGGKALPAGSTGWWRDTAVYSTTMFLFTSLRNITENSTQQRPGYDILSGYNPNFYWKDYDFSGIGYQSILNSGADARFTMISPVHAFYTSHWFGQPGPPIGTTLYFIDKNNNITTNTILSSKPYLAGDASLCILSKPLSTAAYPIGSLQNILTEFSFPLTGLKDFIYGPVGSGRIGAGIPDSACTINRAPTNYRQLISIPKTLWIPEGDYTADSGTVLWYAHPTTKQLVTIGPQSFPINLSNMYLTFYNAATALCKQFYGDPLLYQLSAYNF